MKTKDCPNCGGNLLEDAAEDLSEKEDRTFLMDGFLAYVCEENCGYVERMKEEQEPNIFSFGTTELTQDAFLCWLFEHVRLNRHSVPAKLANNLFRKMKVTFSELYPDVRMDKLVTYRLLKIEQQLHHIDVLLTFESDFHPEKLYIIIEDKVRSGESKKDQVLFYKNKISKSDSNAIIIPVLFKTGFVSEMQKEKDKHRNIVHIGYEEIYEVFSEYELEMEDNVILTSWWEHFLETCYIPIQKALLFEIDEKQTLREINTISRQESHPEFIFFQKITEYLFGGLKGLVKHSFQIQGKGHIDLHYQIRKAAWRDEGKKFEINLYFIWDKKKFSFVIKTAPFPYQSQKRLPEPYKTTYLAAKRKIVNHLKENHTIDLKLTNRYYLQIAQMKGIEELPLGKLKEKLQIDIPMITAEIDRILIES